MSKFPYDGYPLNARYAPLTKHKLMILGLILGFRGVTYKKIFRGIGLLFFVYLLVKAVKSGSLRAVFKYLAFFFK